MAPAPPLSTKFERTLGMDLISQNRWSDAIGQMKMPSLVLKILKSDDLAVAKNPPKIHTVGYITI
jgi:hypothetical protein